MITPHLERVATLLRETSFTYLAQSRQRAAPCVKGPLHKLHRLTVTC